MKVMCKQGYKDALHFLKKNGEKLWLSFVKAVPINKPVATTAFTPLTPLQATFTLSY